MSLWQYSRYVLLGLATIAVSFVIISFADIILAVMHARFYSDAAFVVIFGVGGIFTGLFTYATPLELFPTKNEWVYRLLLAVSVLTGLLFFFTLSKLEGGEYKPAFQSFGIMLALGGCFFFKIRV